MKPRSNAAIYTALLRHQEEVGYGFRHVPCPGFFEVRLDLMDPGVAAFLRHSAHALFDALDEAAGPQQLFVSRGTAERARDTEPLSLLRAVLADLRLLLAEIGSYFIDFYRETPAYHPEQEPPRMSAEESEQAVRNDLGRIALALADIELFAQEVIDHRAAQLLRLEAPTQGAGDRRPASVRSGRFGMPRHGDWEDFRCTFPSRWPADFAIEPSQDELVDYLTRRVRDVYEVRPERLDGTPPRELLWLRLLTLLPFDPPEGAPSDFDERWYREYFRGVVEMVYGSPSEESSREAAS